MKLRKTCRYYERLKKLRKDTKIKYVRECYMDEERTLQQWFVYTYGDDREREYLKRQLNPHVTELVRTVYLNKDFEFIKEESNGKN